MSAAGSLRLEDLSSTSEGDAANGRRDSHASNRAADSPADLEDDARRLRDICPQFRVLLMGPANAGKTTIRERMCGADPTRTIVRDAEGYEISLDELEGSSTQRGLHDITHQIEHPESPGFIFHDSRGVESGGVEEMHTIQHFIGSRAETSRLRNQLHVIWYCMPMDTNRIGNDLEDFFRVVKMAEKVPILLVLTKCEAVRAKELRRLQDAGHSIQSAISLLPRGVDDWFRDNVLDVVKLRLPQQSSVQLRNLHKPAGRLDELSARTAELMTTSVLKRLFVSVQTKSLRLCISSALHDILVKRELRDDNRRLKLDLRELIDHTLIWFPHFAAYDWLEQDEAELWWDWDQLYREERREHRWNYNDILHSAGANSRQDVLSWLLTSSRGSLEAWLVVLAAFLIAAEHSYWTWREHDKKKPALSVFKDALLAFSTSEQSAAINVKMKGGVRWGVLSEVETARQLEKMILCHLLPHPGRR